MESDAESAAAAGADCRWAERAERWAVWQEAKNDRGERANLASLGSGRQGIRIPFFAVALDPVRSFAALIRWWAQIDSLPPRFDPQDPAAVRAWLVTFVGELESAWDWYGAQCGARGIQPKIDVFGPAGSKALDVVGSLEGGRLKFPADYYPQSLVLVRSLILQGLVPRVDKVRALLCPPAPAEPDTTPAPAAAPAAGKSSAVASATATPGRRVPESREAREAQLVGYWAGGEAGDRNRRLTATLDEIVREARIPKRTLQRILKDPKSAVLQRLLGDRHAAR